jgi:hypothetical protein
LFHAPQKSILYSAYRIAIEHSCSSGALTVQGTAFYLSTAERLYLITNRHNLDLVMKHEKYAGYRPTRVSLSGYFGDHYLRCDMISNELLVGFPPNGTEDVAAIDVTNAPFKCNAHHEMQAFYLKESALADDQALAQLNICDMVALPGYPDFFDRNGDRPIMRMGTVASDPISDYRDLDMAPARRIAYEAFSSAGSSGSPVFALAKGWKAGAGLSGGYFRDLMLIGVNAGHLRGRDEMGTSHSGISFCFKSTCIKEAIAAAVKKGP